ncbi:MAG: hypothetical protein KDB01_11470 [Planctomycetaceae bacterium]|nr:hypothetical protein [Planctomycetaceae bacterium]
MATNALKEVITTVEQNENSDDAYQRLYGHQIKPCDFRRWFTKIKSAKACAEIDEEASAAIAGYVNEGMTIEEAFAQHCPDYVGPGEFAVALNRYRRSQAATAAQ